MVTVRQGASIAAFSVIWSSAFVVGKLAVADVDPAVVLFLRFTLGALALAPFELAAARRGFDAAAALRGLGLGLLNNTIYLGLSFAALRQVGPALVIVIVSCSPFVTVALGAALGQEALDGGKLGGMGIGFAGVLVIALGRHAFPGSLAGIGLAALGTLAFCAGTVLFKGRASGDSILRTNFYGSVSAASSLGAVAWASGVPFTDPPPGAWAAIAYLALVVTLVGMALWLHLIRSVGAATASSIHLLNPAVGLVLSYLVLGEPIRGTDIAGSALVAAGLLVVLGRRTAPA